MVNRKIKNLIAIENRQEGIRPLQEFLKTGKLYRGPLFEGSTKLEMSGVGGEKTFTRVSNSLVEKMLDEGIDRRIVADIVLFSMTMQTRNGRIGVYNENRHLIDLNSFTAILTEMGITRSDKRSRYIEIFKKYNIAKEVNTVITDSKTGKVKKSKFMVMNPAFANQTSYVSNYMLLAYWKELLETYGREKFCDILKDVLEREGFDNCIPEEYMEIFNFLQAEFKEEMKVNTNTAETQKAIAEEYGAVINKQYEDQLSEQQALINKLVEENQKLKESKLQSESIQSEAEYSITDNNGAEVAIVKGSELKASYEISDVKADHLEIISSETGEILKAFKIKSTSATTTVSESKKSVHNEFLQ